ncbi:hypothetical protein LP52_15235 [Streptomonospora alba]|uniref:GAF domain-containing protein n=1 Tax=Streptomonospora alba TaxID=183763 RepID=A0A0C2JMF9_9ACTN|nr:GAF domain-containing protein [Streptomonospora alba]KIH98057.1 hypothetical protein LP52_15235 [Streptomonospora alba]
METSADEQGRGIPVTHVVELLDAVAADSEETADEALERSSGKLPAEDLAALTNRVRNLRSLLARWRRRGLELSALFSSARELAELRDTDTLLHRLVERAHDLMGTDVTYLSEFYEGSDELRVRSTLGAVAPSFRELRVPPGMGLASQVVRTRCPQWTSVYHDNRSIQREQGIDAAVAAEGLVSLLGVPLVAGGRVLGVLFAANRSKHEFVPDEIALLSAFADHAAVVLQTTRLLEQARVAAQEAERANSILASNVTAMERASTVHEDLTAVVLRGGSAHEVAETLGKALDRPVTILDRELALIVEPDNGGMHYCETDGDLPHSVHEAIAASRLSGRCVFIEDTAPLPEVAVAIVAAETFLGAVLVGYGDLELREVEQRTIERAAQIAALVEVKQEAVAAAEDRVRGELLSDILRADQHRWQELLLRARARDVRLDELRSVVVATVPADGRRPALEGLRRAVEGGLVGERDGMLVILSPQDDPMTAAHEVRHTLNRVQRGPVLAVAGPPAPSVEALGTCFEAARRCVELMRKLNTTEGTADARAYEPYMAMFGTGGEHLSGFIESTIGPVLRWDEERGTELFETLSAFADSHASPSRTARFLHVHINTVTQRLDRISALLGPEWREPESLFRVSVAARLHALARPKTVG